MKNHKKEIAIETKESLELIDITQKVTDAIKQNGINEGICLINSLHTTAAIIVNENDPDLKQDILNKIRNEFPENENYNHRKNAHSHLTATFLGHSQTLPVKNGELTKGTWQSIFLLETDGPRTRKIIIQTLGL